MKEKIGIGIVGFGNLGKGAALAVQKSEDLELKAIFTRRDPGAFTGQAGGVPFFHVDQAEDFTGAIDVLILCGGSATDLPAQSPFFARRFNIVDSFDTHAKIPEHFDAVNKAALENDKTAAISIGWDPGLFSLNRMIAEAILPEGHEYTFWGRGVSQGHSEAIRRVPGVKDGVQYTIPVSSALDRVRAGETPRLTAGEKHIRDCYVVVEEGADKEKIAAEIRSMPHYFAGYETRVTFISENELKAKYSGMPHGGFVIRSGRTGKPGAEYNQVMEFSLKLQSNPQFTAGVLAAYARAVFRLNREGHYGAKTIFDIPPAYISMRSGDDLRRTLL